MKNEKKKQKETSLDEESIQEILSKIGVINTPKEVKKGNINISLELLRIRNSEVISPTFEESKRVMGKLISSIFGGKNIYSHQHKKELENLEKQLLKAVIGWHKKAIGDLK